MKPTSVAALLGNHEAYLTFRQIVQQIIPDAADELLAVPETGADRESARVWAFLQRIERDYFPCYDPEEYEGVIYGIPFVRHGWSYDDFHEVELRPGELLMFALCEQPFADGNDTRIALLDACEAHVPHMLLADLPDAGISPADLHQRLDDTPLAAAAEFADWLWGDTGTVFLDLDDETEVADAAWTRENVLELTEQWGRAKGILDRIANLAAWLEEDPPGHFRQLVGAALGRDPHLLYEQLRRLYACEITEEGVVPIPHDESDAITLPVGPAG
ncbi:MAG: hypothetical protein HY689_14375 [Chloroflexi bacterium]|nr:hypothetical protein [Chloroflexota bacterium]